MRYPPKFAVTDGPHILPQDWVASNVDLAATIFELTGIAKPTEYQMDGVSYVQDMVRHIQEDGDNVLHADLQRHESCQFAVIDIENSHSIVSDR